MATYISVTNTFASGAVAASGEVNTNFTDIVNGLSDGTKDIHVRDASVTSAIVTGNVSVGRTTFESWSGGNAIQLNDTGFWLGNSTNPYSYFGNNCYYDGSWKYLESDCYVYRHAFENQGMSIKYAASGTADAAITFIEILQHKAGGGVIFNAGQDTGEDFRVDTSGQTSALLIDSGTDKIYSNILKTTQAQHANDALLAVDTDTGEVYSITPV